MDLSILNLSKQFGNKQVLKNLSINLQPGKIYGLLGLNGAGKTTLIKCIFNELKPNTGLITINQHPMMREDYTAMYYFPENDDLPNNTTVYDYLIRVYRLARKDPHNFSKAFNEYGAILHGINIHKTKISKLSTGQRKIVSLIACRLVQPKIIILDEPTANLDIANKETVLKMVLKMKNEDTIIVLTTHLIDEIKEYLDHIIILHQGQIVADQTTSGLDIKQKFLEAINYDEHQLYE